VLAAEVGDRLREVGHSDRLDSRQRSLRRGAGGADDPGQLRTPGTLGDGEDPGDRTDSPVECELTMDRVADPARRANLSGRGEDRERDRQVERRPLLTQRRRREVDRDPAARPLQLRRANTTLDPLLRLLTGPIGQAHDREPRHLPLDVRLHLDPASLEADQSMRERAREHAATLRRSFTHV
jgi:hypothetical protein